MSPLLQLVLYSSHCSACNSCRHATLSVRYKHLARAYSECPCEDKYGLRAGLELVGRVLISCLTSGRRKIQILMCLHVLTNFNKLQYVFKELRFVEVGNILVSVPPDPFKT